MLLSQDSVASYKVFCCHYLGTKNKNLVEFWGDEQLSVLLTSDRSESARCDSESSASLSADSRQKPPTLFDSFSMNASHQTSRSSSFNTWG